MRQRGGVGLKGEEGKGLSMDNMGGWWMGFTVLVYRHDFRRARWSRHVCMCFAWTNGFCCINGDLLAMHRRPPPLFRSI